MVVQQDIPENNKNYCSNCGAEDIDKCPKCKFAFKGDIHDEGLFSPMNKKSIPKYCPNCGETYPWTKAKLEALDDMIDLIDELNDTEKEELKEASKFISTDNSRTQISVYKFKHYSTKIVSSLGDKLEELLIEIASETAIKFMKELGILPK